MSMHTTVPYRDYYLCTLLLRQCYSPHLFAPHPPSLLPAPQLFDYLLGNVPAVNITGLQPSSPLHNPILFDTAGQYILPFGAVIEVLINNTGERA